MRLIDADAFRERFRNGEASTKEEMLWNHTVRRMIEEQPTVDAVPVVRGEWVCIEQTTTYYETLIHEQCSVCGRKLTRTSKQTQVNFCPKCGADMRKKVE